MSGSSKAACLLAFIILFVQDYVFASEITATRNMTGFPPCDALMDAGLSDRLLFATDPGYEPRIASWWALNTRLRPWCLIQPHDAAEVSKTMIALLGAGDGAGDWHIAVRSGGHSLGNTNNIDTGVTIDLGKLNQTTYDNETNTASIGPGGRWKNVYAELHDHGVIVTGGRDGDVGVGGFLLGGGLTYFIGRESFGCDSIKNYEVVLANGTIVNANKGENSDLWMALRGGGSNFGIVTRFDMEALPDKDLAHGVRFMSGNHSSELVDVLVDFTDHYQELDTDALVGFVIHNASINPAGVTAVALHVNTEGIHNSTGFEKLNQIPTILPDETRSLKLSEAAQGSGLASGSWISEATLTFKNDQRILAHAVELHDRYVQEMSAAFGAEKFESIVFLQPLPTFFSEISNRKGGNMLGLDNQEYNAIVWTGHVAVTTNEQDLAFAEAKMMAMAAELTSYSTSLSGSNRLIYMNYAGSTQDVLGSYGKKSVDHIRDVAAKFDPTGAFQTRVPGGFKISRVDV